MYSWQNSNPGYISTVPYYRPNIYQPQPMPQPMEQMPPIQATGIIKVNGRAGAEAFHMNAPNAMAALFDANEDIFYLKTTDGAGYPTVEAYSFTRLADAAPTAQTEDFICREEFEKFKTDLEEAIRNVQQSVQRKTTAVKASAATPE